jgi:hypothetical protein
MAVNDNVSGSVEWRCRPGAGPDGVEGEPEPQAVEHADLAVGGGGGGAGVRVGLARIAALYHRPPASYQIL